MKIIINLSMFVLLTVCSATVLGNEEEFENFFKNQPARARGSKSDLKQFWNTGECDGCNLQGFDLRAAIEKLNKEQKQINLENANCCKTNMERTNISNANLAKGNFSEASFVDSNLNGVCASSAYMDYAYLVGANIENADFSKTYLKRTMFWLAKVNEKTSFADAVCVFTNFREIWGLGRANFTGAILHKCDMSSPVCDKMRKQAASIVGTILRFP